jgi:hypothetical protein
MVAALTLSLLAISTPSVEIRVVAHEGWGDANLVDVKALLNSTAQDLLKYFPDRKLRPILVRYGGSPVTLGALGPEGQQQIILHTQNNLWSQYAYQFSHEMTHVLASWEKFDSNSPPNMWFEESICTVGSFFTMRQMANTWKTSPPFPNWKDYAVYLNSYVDEEMDKPERKLPAGMTLAKWYQANKVRLRTGSCMDPEARHMQAIVASVLLPMFEKSPEDWPAIGYLNTKKTGESSFKEYLDAWEQSAPQKHRKFIGHVRAQFGKLE